MRIDDALVEIMREWRALPPDQRATREQVNEFAKSAVDRHPSRARKNKVKIVVGFLEREMETISLLLEASPSQG